MSIPGLPTTVNDTRNLPAFILAKIEDQVDRTQHLLTLLPAESLEWRPTEEAFRVCDLLGHLLECLAGFCACLHALYPEKLSHFQDLRRLEVNHCCGISEAATRIEQYWSRIAEGFALLSDGGLSRVVPTAFSTDGEPAITMLLGNLEHLINHKYQLFYYLKIMGIEVGTRDLYKLRSLPI